jgi:hypothetical protein
MMALGDDECGPPSGPSQGPPPFTEAAEGAAAEEESASAAGDAGEAPPPVEVGEAEEAAALRRSMGTSPLSAAEEEERQRRSMGTSPIAPGLLEAAAGGASCGADEAAPMETDGCSDAGSPAAFDDNESLDGSDGGGDETQEPDGGPTLDELVRQNIEEKFEQPPQPAAQKPRAGRKRKTSLDRIGRLEGEVAARTGLVVDPASQGARRSKRNRIQPLEYWRNERVEYGRRDSAKFECPVAVTRKPRDATPVWEKRARERISKPPEQKKGK